MTQAPKNRTDLLPHYSRLIATLNKYMPDIGSEVVAFVSQGKTPMPPFLSSNIWQLDEEFRYLQRKKNVVKELAEVRLKVRHYFNAPRMKSHFSKNIIFLSNLTKFHVVPPHVILHMFKVCLDDFSGTNVENIALLLEGCGRFLLRSEDTTERFSTMVNSTNPTCKSWSPENRPF